MRRNSRARQRHATNGGFSAMNRELLWAFGANPAAARRVPSVAPAAPNLLWRVCVAAESDAGLEPASVFTRREPTDLPKCERQVSLTRESATVCDLRNAHVRLAEQSAGALDPPIQNIAMRRHTSSLAKRPEEMTAAIASHRRELPKGEIRIQTALNQLLNTGQFS